MDTAQMFRLIDSVLFFEACLYHQVLPLALEENRLLLGMVNPEDTAALDYISRILSHMNCLLVPQSIASDVHQSLLSAYLNYREKSKPATERRQSLHTVRSRAETVKVDLHERPTLILTNTLEEALDSDREESRSASSSPEAETVNAKDSQTPIDVSSVEVEQSQSPERSPIGGKLSYDDSHLTDIIEEEGRQDRGKQGKKSGKATKAVLQPNNSLLVLEVQAQYLSHPVELLATLPPKELLQELLGRVLAGGIGRLHFEWRAPNSVRVLWSRDGVLLSVLEQLPVTVFQETINELKRLTHIPLTPVQVRTLTELDCLYQKNRLLIRLQVLPGEYGEQVTLQILRGAALKFYQRQQVSHLSRDALAIARQLLRKVNELQKRAHLNALVEEAPAKECSRPEPNMSPRADPAEVLSWSNDDLDTEPLELPPDINELLESLDLINESVQAAANIYKIDENTD